MMTALEMVNRRVSYQVDVHSRESLEYHTRHHDAQKDRTAVRAKIEAADDLAVQHIMRTQALEAGARVDTLEDTASRRKWHQEEGPQAPRLNPGYNSPTIVADLLPPLRATCCPLQAMIGRGCQCWVGSTLTVRPEMTMIAIPREMCKKEWNALFGSAPIRLQNLSTLSSRALKE
ncbi:hypothetical protein Tco_0351827 [Tanacetum coccineum]